MKGKLAVLAGLGAGYVLGTRAGRERYEQIRSGAQRLWQDPRVREQRERATQTVKDQAGRAGETLKEKAEDRLPHHGAHTSEGPGPVAGGGTGGGASL